MTDQKTIHDEMREKVELAFAYAEDGAFGRAAELFKEVADEYENRLWLADRELVAAMLEQMQQRA